MRTITGTHIYSRCLAASVKTIQRLLTVTVFPASLVDGFAFLFTLGLIAAATIVVVIATENRLLSVPLKKRQKG